MKGKNERENIERLLEVAYVFRNRMVGRSKLGLKEYITYLIDVIGLIKNKYFIKD